MQIQFKLTMLIACTYTCFVEVNGFITRVDQPMKELPRVPHGKCQYKTIPYRHLHRLAAGSDEENEVETKDNFDGKGLANYLGPYALALVASVVVTASFVKYVLMDY